MKTITLIPGFVAATLFLTVARGIDAPAPATGAEHLEERESATGNPAAETTTGLTPRDRELIKRFDLNGDGRLDEAEKAAAKESLRTGEMQAGASARKRLLERFDRNHDGTLDDAEQASALAVLEKRPQFIRRFDRDGDGRLNESERAAAITALNYGFSKKAAKK